MLVVYQIVDWETHFENDRSRTRDRCRFVCIPNKQHGMGFSFIMSQSDGASIYGVFQLITGACSQQLLPRLGWLTDTGKPTGRPWHPADIALRYRRHEAEIARALEVICCPMVAWIKKWEVDDYDILVNSSPTTNLRLTSDSPPSHLEEKGIEGNRREGKGKEAEVSALLLPAVLNNDKFKKVWGSWTAQRMKGKKVKNWTDLFTKQLEWIAGYPEPVAIEILNYSIRNDYQGLFEPKNYGTNQQNGGQRYDRNAGTANENGISDYSKAAEKSQQARIIRKF